MIKGILTLYVSLISKLAKFAGLLLIIFITIPGIMDAKTYYVSLQGNDSNSGTSSAPWKTIAKVNSASLYPGDVVSFKTGQKFADAVLNCKKGVTYDTYGGTTKAIIGDNTKSLSTEATIKIYNEDVTLYNLKIYGYYSGRSVIIYSKGGLSIKNCEIIGGNNAHSVQGRGIRCLSSGITKHTNIINNSISELFEGIYIPQPYNVDVSYNKIYNMFCYNGGPNYGGLAIRAHSGGISDAFDCKYTFKIHHNEVYNFEYTVMYVGSVSRVLVEYNYIHDNLDERLYMGGTKHGGVGKFFDNTGQTIGSVGNIFRYNYVYNIQRRGLPRHTYGRPTVANIKAGIPKIISSSGTNNLAIYIISSSQQYTGVPDAVLSGLGYGNIWIHNNIFYKSTHQLLAKGYTLFNSATNKGGSGSEGKYRPELGSYFINNTIIDYGNSSITNSLGIIYTEITSASPLIVINNIIDIDNANALMAGYYKEKGGYSDYNIYITRTGTTTYLKSGQKYATYFPSINTASGNGEKYSTDPNWNSISSKILASKVGIKGVYIPDIRIKKGGKAYNTGMDYDLIGDTYTDKFGKHLLGKDPTGRSFAYDILGNLRATNDIGAVGIGSSTSSVALKVFLEASFENGKMNTRLNSSAFLPKDQPYNVSPWNVNDSSIMTSSSENYVDWVLIQLKDDTESIKYSKAGILTEDGTVVCPDGSPFSFSNISSGEYYIAVVHRNHLPVMSSGKIQVNNGEEIEYNFTYSQDQAYGGSMADLGGGKYGLSSGDADGNGIINALDYESVKSNIFKKGYKSGDLDLNGIVNILDYIKIKKNLSKSSRFSKNP